MQIKFLGTGGAFDYQYENAAIWITFRGFNILLDCGNSTYPRLRELALDDRIDYILVTHLHDDHAGSLSTTILHQYHMLKPARKARILTPNESFAQVLRDFLSFSITALDTYVDFFPLETLPGLRAVDTTGLHIKGMPSYGYIFEDQDEIVAVSGDLGNPDIIFSHLDPAASKPVRVFHDIAFELSDGVHVYYKDLQHRLEQFRIFGYHVDPTQNPADNAIPLVADLPELLF
ncbi:MAG: MBL fold metallo-hydrolase [Bacteroidia bacterium]|nr:MBL fold metallo-hydrolase [Bacteroidia bacterium]